MNAVVVTWLGSLGATGYTATATNGGLTKTCTAALLTCTMSNVTAGSWSVTVTATGLGGTSVASGAIIATATDPLNPPGMPTGVIAAAGSRQATVSWTAPGNVGAGISSYTATAIPGGASCTTAGLSCTITGLTQGGIYTFTVTATAPNGAGTSLGSLPSPLTAIGPPGPPTAVVVVALPTSAQVTWVGPLVAGAGIDHYLVTASPGGQTCTALLLTCTVTGLTSGTDYTFSVVAIGVGSTGTSTATVSSAATPGPPGPPRNVTVTPGLLTLHVSWDAPLQDGAGISGYAATASPGLLGCVTLSASDRDCTILNLVPSTSYTVTVVAVGIGLTGTSAASPPSAPATPGPPGAPTAVTATPGSGSAAVSWTAPANAGTGITGYSVTASPGGGGRISLTTSCTVPLLTPGTAYTFTVVANSLAGASPASAASSAVSPGPPGVPTAVTATAGNGSAAVSWTAPANTGAGVSGYTVVAAPGGATCTTAGTGCTVTGLTNGVAYTFAVVATGSGSTGASLPSTLSSPVVPGPPNVPVLPVAVAGIGSATVSWTAPVITRAGLTGYQVTASPGGASCSTSGTTCTVTGLSAGTDYTFGVVATGPGGSSAAAAAATAATPGPPGAPTGINAVALDAALTVSWTPPLLSGNLVNIYVATATPGLNACVTVNASQHSCTITGLDDGTAYTVAVVAVGLGLTGSSPPSIPSTPVTPGPPDTPTAVTAVAGSTSASVSWAAPATTRAGITGYTVTASPGGATCTTVLLTCNVSGLTSGTPYTFTVVATGLGGSSSASAASVAVTPGPTGVTASGGSGSAAVSWTAPANPGGGIAGYTVTALPGGATCTTAGLGCTVSGLTNGVGYVFRVVANGVAGTGDSAPSLPTALIAPGAPDAPTAVLGVAGSAQVTVSWVPPLIVRAGVTGYTVTATPGGATCTTSGTSCAVTGLTGGTPYTFTVVANGVLITGTSAPSAPSSPVTPGAPDAPTAVTAVPGAGVAAVSWTAPVVTRAGVTSYTVTASPGGATCTTSTTGCTVAGLTGGTPYTFTVVATGAGGASPASVASTAVTPGPPGAPTAVTVTGGSASATVSWTAPANLGGGVDRYVATASPGGASCTTTGTSCVITGLADGTPYTFSVVAVGSGSTGASPAAVTVTTVTPGAPDAPITVLAVAGDGAAAVSWTAPPVRRAGVTGYTVTASPGGATCTTAALTCTVPGLSGGTTYTFTVVATGPGGSSGPSVASPPTVPGPPDAPTGVTVAAGNGTAAVSWTAPANVGAGIAGYTVTASPGGATCSTLAVSTTCTVTGLSNGTGYTFTVVANGVAGTGDSDPGSTTAQPGAPDAPTFVVVATGPAGPSAPGAPSPVVVPGPPPAPSVVTITPGNGQLSVTRVPGTGPSAGPSVTGHTATVTPGGATCTSTGTHCTITGLSNGVPYTVTVVANGTGGTSAPTAAATPAVAGPPAAPTNVSVTPRGQRGDRLLDRAGVRRCRHHPLRRDRHTRRADLHDHRHQLCRRWPAPGRDGELQRRGERPRRPSAPAASGSVQPGPPAAPTAVVAAIGNGSATVSWAAGAGAGSSVDVYTVTASPGGATCITQALGCTVTGLTNGVAYTFTVVANGTGTSGSSLPSTASVAVTPVGTLPGSVSGLTVVAGNGSANVSWTAPAVTGGGIDHYEVFTDDGHSCVTTGTSCTVTGLVYRFRVLVFSSVMPSSPVGDWFSASIIPLSTAPIAPTAVAATAGDTSAVVTWTAPSGGPAVTGYLVTASPGGQTCTTVTTTCTVTGLTNGLAYTFTVVTQGGGGTSSAASTPSNTVVPAASIIPSNVVPAAPAAVTADAGDQQATVSWTPAATGVPAVSYTVTASPGGATCTTTGTTCTVAGLTNGIAYVFTVVASGSSGDSPPSPPSTAVYPSAAPDAPTGVTVTARHSGLLVQWQLPADAGTGISHFSATSSISDGRCVTTTGTATQCVMFVPIGDEYQVSVVAHGLFGQDSPPVDTMTGTFPTFPTMPDVPPEPGAVGQLSSNLGTTGLVLGPGDPIVLDASGFAPNSSVRFAAYTTPDDGVAGAGLSAAGMGGGATVAAVAVNVDVLGTPTAGSNGMATLFTSVPLTADPDKGIAFMAEGVGPDGSVRSLVLWANLNIVPPVVVPPVVVPPVVTPPVVTPAPPVVLPVRHAPARRTVSSGADTTSELAATGDPVWPTALAGVLLLLLGVVLRRYGRPAPTRSRV